MTVIFVIGILAIMVMLYIIIDRLADLQDKVKANQEYIDLVNCRLLQVQNSINGTKPTEMQSSYLQRRINQHLRRDYE